MNQDLVKLRVSVARMAQLLGVETEDKRVLGKSFEALAAMSQEPRGWNTLAGECAIAIRRQRDELLLLSVALDEEPAPPVDDESAEHDMFCLHGGTCER